MYIFLDLDGVMIPAKSWRKPDLLPDDFPVFSSKATTVLNKILRPETTVVLTSSHKSSFSIEQWQAIFSVRGIKINRLLKLADNTKYLNRKDEILHWFKSNTLDQDFLILDDDTSLNDLPTNLKNALVLTSPMIGLTEAHLPKIESLFKRENQHT